MLFTERTFYEDIKDKGELCNGQYFRDKITTENVFPFLKNEENVIDPEELYLFIIKRHVCEPIRLKVYLKTTTSSFGAICMSMHKERNKGWENEYNERDDDDIT